MGFRFERFWWVESLGVLRYAQDDSKNGQRQEYATAGVDHSRTDNGSSVSVGAGEDLLGCVGC